MKELEISIDKCNLTTAEYPRPSDRLFGARITYTLAMQMKKNNLKLGLASLLHRRRTRNVYGFGESIGGCLIAYIRLFLISINAHFLNVF